MGRKEQLGPVVEGKLKGPGGGHVEMIFGAPAGARVGPGAKVGPRQLRVQVDAEGEHTEEITGTALRGIAVPTCGVDRVWQTLVGSGAAADATLELRYAFDKKADRAVWSAWVQGQPETERKLDGSTCAIIVRR